jgi:hypothetical protein
VEGASRARNFGSITIAEDADLKVEESWRFENASGSVISEIEQSPSSILHPLSNSADSGLPRVGLPLWFQGADVGANHCVSSFDYRRDLRLHCALLGQLPFAVRCRANCNSLLFTDLVFSLVL